MLFDYIRLFKDTGSLSDVSIDNQDDSANVTANLTSSQYFYVAQKMPFTNLFVHIATANSVTSSLGIEYWNGSEWIAAVDVLDATKVSGATLGRSGIIQWSNAKDEGWAKVGCTEDNGSPTELSSLTIFDCYWVRIKPTVSLHASTSLKEITYAFTNTQELSNFDIEISTYLASFETGKTDWVKEIITASKLVVTDFRRKGLIVHPGQIVDMTDVSFPCALRTLMLIYSNLGPSYKEKIAAMQVEYDKVMNIARFTLDTNGTGKIEATEQTNVVRTLVR
jgi:hypothetical protein